MRLHVVRTIFAVTTPKRHERNSTIAPQKWHSDFRSEHPFEMQMDFLGGGDRYKIVYTDVAVKSRCVAEFAYIACIINTL